MTELLYLKDSYMKECDAEVVEVNKEDSTIILDKTIFYPKGGGQECDKGEIETPDGKIRVIWVDKKDGKVRHEVDDIGLSLKPGSKIKCKIEWERRYKLMRSHTTTHILAETIFRQTGALITGNNMDLEKCRIDFSLENNDAELMKKAVEDSNNIIKQNLPIKIEFMSIEKAEKIPQLSKLAKGLPESLKEIRVVSIGDYDIQGDGGTHVNNTSEIGKIEFIKVDNRGKNNRRIYFKIID